MTTLPTPTSQIPHTWATATAAKLKAQRKVDAINRARYAVFAHRNANYNGADLKPFSGRAGANDALALPSRMADTLHYRDGRTVHAPIPPKPLKTVHGDC